MNQGRSGIRLANHFFGIGTHRIAFNETWVGNGRWMVRRDQVLPTKTRSELPSSADGWRELTQRLEPALQIDTDAMDGILNDTPAVDEVHRLQPTAVCMTPFYTPAAPLPVDDMLQVFLSQDTKRHRELIWVRKVWAEKLLMLGQAYQVKEHGTIYIINPGKKGDVTPLAVILPHMISNSDEDDHLVVQRLVQLRGIETFDGAWLDQARREKMEA